MQHVAGRSSSADAAVLGVVCCWAVGGMLLGLGLGVMRGERERPPLRGAYWVLAAIYLIASLGHAVASGNEQLVALALCAPAGIVLFPCIVAEGASVATESVVDQLWELEHSEDSIAASVDAWVDGFMHDFKRLHRVNTDKGTR